ncbi:MAG: cell division protein SepF [Clostridia bacterium]|nr:cell division protein SepF [Clostridia bacterium]
MKIKFTRKDNDGGFNDFNADEGYYPGFDEEDNDVVEDDGFSSGGFGAPSAPEAAPFGASGAVALKIVNPKGYSNASEIADYLMNGNTVLLNIEGLTRESAVRLLDYLSGAVHVLGGMMKKVGKTTIVVAPKNVDVSSIEEMVGSDN